LNDEFEGGEIVFDRAQLVVKPHRGLLLAFPSDADHVHEILPVRSGIRYTMPIWFTKQQRFALAGLPPTSSPAGIAARNGSISNFLDLGRSFFSRASHGAQRNWKKGCLSSHAVLPDSAPH
jgi:hypothetical protein